MLRQSGFNAEALALMLILTIITIIFFKKQLFKFAFYKSNMLLLSFHTDS